MRKTDSDNIIIFYNCFKLEEQKKMNPDIAIKLENISKSYKLYDSPQDRMKEALHPFRKKYHRDFYALRDINLDVKKGEILGIVGRNGSGKSTLLKIITGVLTPTTGTVQTRGRISAILELGAGFNPNFTGLENIYHNLSINGLRKNEIDPKVDEIIEFSELGDFIKQPVKTYSSGMNAKLAFAVSTSVDPDILILDEVLSVGDALFQRKCFARMEKYFKTGKTVIFVSHNTQSVLNLCTSALLLSNGKIISQGKTKNVVIEYEKILFGSSDFENSTDKSNNKINSKEDAKNTTENKTLNKDIVKKKKIIKFDSKDESYYLPKLVSKSRRVVQNYDVTIEDVYFENHDRKRVNVLQQDQHYTLNFIAQFNIEIDIVSFAMCFLTKDDIVLGFSGGLSTPIEQEINAKPDCRYLIKWNFLCNLLPGYFFANIQITGKFDEVFINLVDVKDAIAFKVFNPYKNKYGGLVHFFQEVSYEKVYD